MRPEERRVGVEIGPHPPPPMASIKPANNPRGERNLPDIRLLTITLPARLKAKRARIYAPRLKRKIAMIGAAASAEMELSTTAPTNAPTPPVV
jgi:hypothetical protein